MTTTSDQTARPSTVLLSAWCWKPQDFSSGVGALREGGWLLSTSPMPTSHQDEPAPFTDEISHRLGK